MANYFDQFDAAPAQAAPNYFDQFDAPAQAAPQSEAAPAKEPFTLADTWPVKLAKAIYGGVTYPGDVYQGNATVPGTANMPGTAPDSSPYGQATGENATGIDRTANLASVAPVSQVVDTAAIRSGAPLGSQLKASASSNYKAATALPVELKPTPVDEFSKALQSSLHQDGFNDVTAPVSMKILGMLEKAPKDSVATTQNLRSVQKSLGIIKDKNADPTERMVAGMALDHFNNFLENLAPTDLAKGTPEQAAQFSSLVKQANGDYRAYRQAQTFDQRGTVAENNTHAANSGMNLENNLRTQVRQILNKPQLQRGYDAETLRAMQAFNDGSRGENTVRMAGNMLGGGGGWGMLASGTIGHLLGLPIEALPAIGIALKQAGNARAANQFAGIEEMIRANSPLAKSGVTSLAPRSPTAISAVTKGARLLPQSTSLDSLLNLVHFVPAPADNQQQ